jgi:hypothetical protein
VPRQTHQTSGSKSRNSRFARGTARGAGRSAGAHGSSAETACACASCGACGARHWPASPPDAASLQRSACQRTRRKRVARERPSTETDSLSVPVPCTRPTCSRDNAALQRVTPDQRRGVLRFLKRRRASEQGYATAGCGLRTAAGGAAARAWSMQSASKARALKPSRAPSRPATWLEQRPCQARVTTARP